MFWPTFYLFRNEIPLREIEPKQRQELNNVEKQEFSAEKKVKTDIVQM